MRVRGHVNYYYIKTSLNPNDYVIGLVSFFFLEVENQKLANQLGKHNEGSYHLSESIPGVFEPKEYHKKM